MKVAEWRVLGEKGGGEEGGGGGERERDYVEMLCRMALGEKISVSLICEMRL